MADWLMKNLHNKTARRTSSQTLSLLFEERMDEFERELKLGFLDEASQLMADTEQCFLQLETSSGDTSVLEKIFRLAHNLKGSAKAVGFDELGEFTHQLESLLLKMKNKEIPISGGTVSLLLRCNDQIVTMIAALKTDPESKTDCSVLLAEIQNNLNGVPSAQTTPAQVAAAPKVQEVASPQPVTQVSAEAPAVDPVANAALKAELDALLEAQCAAPQRLSQASAESVTPAASVVTTVHAAPPAPAPKAAASGGAASTTVQVDESIRVSLNRLEKLLNFVGEMVILQSVLREQVQESASMLMKKTVNQLAKVTKEVQDISMGLRMVPLKQTFQKMQRIVRDTSSKLDKKINLKLVGEDTEVDKTILESLGDPLVHLVRNSVDHGVETPRERLAAGKPEQGEIILSAYHQSGTLVIEVRDDGAGLNATKLINKAIEKGILKPGTQLSDEQAYALIFHSGFSTKAVVSDVSGRGVGMDVVKTNIERLQGTIQIETVLGQGTCFKINLPLTLAIVDGMTIQCEKERYVIPLAHVHESVKPNPEDIHFVTGMGEVFALRGESIPLYRLNDLLGRKSAKASSDMIAIVVRNGKTAIAVLVDDILGQSQIVIKQLGAEHQNLKGFSGSAILGDGKPALILELAELVARYKPSVVSRSTGISKGVAA